MARGIELTLQVIAQSKNQAATGLLESAFQSTHETIRKLSGKILVSRRTGQGLETLIRHFDPQSHEMVELVRGHREKLTAGLHGAIVNEDLTLARQAFRLAYTQEFFEVLPTLASFCLGPGSQDRTGTSMIADFLKFLDKFTIALDRNDPTEHTLLYNNILPEFVKILVQKIKEYQYSRHELPLTVYIRLYPFLSEVGMDRDLYIQLRISTSAVYAAVYRRLLKQSEPYLFRFIMRCMERFNPPPIVAQVIAGRADVPFLEALFNSIRNPLSLELKTNLANLPPLPWLSQIDSFLSPIDPQMQIGFVLFLQNIFLEEEDRQNYLQKVFDLGKGEGRAAALAALVGYSGTRIEQRLWEASGDQDPIVQVEAFNQLMTRNIPGAVMRIIQFVGSPHEIIRETIKKLIPNFRFNRLIHMFDRMEEEQRRQMFDVVRIIDKDTPQEMSNILSSEESILKENVFLCLDYFPDFIPLVEDALCDVLMGGTIPSLRRRAAELLVNGQRNSSRTVLVQALHRDESMEVRDAAKKSLENRPFHWNPVGENE